MKDLAALIIILLFLAGAGFTFFVPWPDWTIEESPITGICYEVRSEGLPIGIAVAMSPVDDSYCEEAK